MLPSKPVSGAPARMSAKGMGELIESARQGQRNRRGGPPVPPTNTDHDEVLVKNTTGEAVDRCGILTLDGVLIEPEDNEAEFVNKPVFLGVKPADGDTLWCVLKQPLRDGAIGRAVVSGVTAVRLEINGEEDTHVEPRDDDVSQLRSSGEGVAEILWKEAGSGEDKWALIRFGSTGGKCDEVHQLFIEGTPTTGNFDLQYALDADPDDMTGPVTDTITIPYDADQDDVKTAFAAHSVLADLITGGASIDDFIVVTPGQLPSTSIEIVWIGIFAGRAILFVSVNSAGLDSGKAKIRRMSSANWQGYL